jgi:hypothetical protein
MTRLAQLAAVVVDRKPRRPLARHQGGLLVGRARTDRNQRAGDTTSDELVPTRRLRTLVPLDPTLTALTAHAPRLLTRKKLSEHVPPTVTSGEALVTLAPMPRPPIRPVQMHPRARLLRPRARRPRRARPRHPTRPPSRPGAFRRGLAGAQFVPLSTQSGSKLRPAYARHTNRPSRQRFHHGGGAFMECREEGPPRRRHSPVTNPIGKEARDEVCRNRLGASDGAVVRTRSRCRVPTGTGSRCPSRSGSSTLRRRVRFSCDEGGGGAGRRREFRTR